MLQNNKSVQEMLPRLNTMIKQIMNQSASLAYDLIIMITAGASYCS